jgi:hypothetical protein
LVPSSKSIKKDRKLRSLEHLAPEQSALRCKRSDPAFT